MASTALLRERIAHELNRQPSELIGDPSLSVGLVINREINSAIRHYETMRTKWNESREVVWGETTSGTRYYSLSGSSVTFLEVDSVKVEYNNSYLDLIERSWKEIEEKDRQITGSLGLPQDYVIYGRQMRLYPVPNQSLTILLSGITRPLLTSLTGSFTSTGSTTPTSTASHNNRLGGWYDDGQDLIKERAVASIRISYLRDERAIAEQLALMARNKPYLSLREENAYGALRDEVNDYLSTGKITPYYI